MSLKIGIILGSTREGRVSPDVGQWVYEQAKDRTDVSYEIVDIKSFDLPFIGTTKDMSQIISALLFSKCKSIMI